MQSIRAPDGAEVRAIHRGRVAFSDWLRGFGLLTIVDHGSGYMTLYAHTDVLYKSMGDWVEGGEPIATADLVEYAELVLNLETYQATIAKRPLDLTYMEYELLKFLAQNPGKVFTRELLLSRVWGYEYYGGARTVDVHIRRLRAKLGEEYAGLIATVRSVGYRFGQSRWKS